MNEHPTYPGNCLNITVSLLCEACVLILMIENSPSLTYFQTVSEHCSSLEKEYLCLQQDVLMV